MIVYMSARGERERKSEIVRIAIKECCRVVSLFCY